jgi:membrane-associated phospholipid phosphatase
VFGAAAGLLLGSWFLPPTRAWWDLLDVATFRTLNGSLDGPRAWQVFWAAANHRAADLVPLAFMLWLLARYVFAGTLQQAAQRSALLAAAVCAMLIARQVAEFDAFEVDRNSPTWVLDDPIRLSELVPWIDAKDASRHSFPGDHCLFLTMLAIFTWRAAGWRNGAISAGAAVVFSLPRLVSGAHWLTDDLVGSAAIALLAMGAFFGTPLHAVLAGWFEPLTTWVLARWQRFARERRPGGATSSAP